jgi:multimeric flavodoxin WrbA
MKVIGIVGSPRKNGNTELLTKHMLKAIMAQLILWFQILGFYIPGSTYWNMAIGREKGEVKQDEEGLWTAWNFGKNMAFLSTARTEMEYRCCMTQYG